MLYRPAVAGYLQATQAQFDKSANLIGQLQHRQAHIAQDGNLWGRLIANQSSHKTSTFGYEQASQTLQFGKDIYDQNSKNSQTKAGITASIGQQSVDYYDQVRAKMQTGIYTGQSSSNDIMLGAYYTSRNEVNPYMDLQAQLISSQNKFKDVYNGTAKQTGLGVALSAELGKEVAMGSTDLTLTPQAQFIYQNFNYGSFKDDVSNVAKQSAESLRLRAGVTLQSNKTKTIANKTNWNASLNVWQELLDGPTRKIGGSEVTSNSTQKAWAELGVGIQYQLNEANQLNAQIGVQKSISGNQRTGNTINVSYRFKW